MSLSVAQLTTPISRQQALDELLGQLDALGFSASSWQAGSKKRTFVEIAAIVWADLSLTVRTLAETVFLSKASGVLLTGLVKSHYDLTRTAAIATQGIPRLTAAATSGPHTITVGQLVAADAAGRTFRNVTGGVLTLGGTLDLTWEAEVAGSDGNIANNTLTVLKTPIAGVTINNPGPGAGVTWITRNGADEEADATLKARAISRWAQLSIEKPADGYIGIALGVAGVTRVEVDANNPGGEGTVDVWAAGASGTVGGATLTALQTALNAKRAVSAIVTARAALEQAVAISGTVFVEAAFNNADKQNEIRAAAQAYINGLPIGGTVLPPAVTGVVDREQLIAAIKEVEGVVSVSLTSPAADVALPAHTIATTGTPSFGFTAV